MSLFDEQELPFSSEYEEGDPSDPLAFELEPGRGMGLDGLERSPHRSPHRVSPHRDPEEASAAFPADDTDAGVGFRAGGAEAKPGQPNSREAADTLAQFAFRVQGENMAMRLMGTEPYSANEEGAGEASTRRGRTREQTQGSAGKKAAPPPATATPPSKKRKAGAAVARTPEAGPAATDSHFIVHLFVTAIAEGKLEKSNMVPKTWDVLQQVVTKVSKEQNTTVCVQGSTLEIKMRVFVCNSVEARAVGEYVSAHPNQRPAPFVVLARQLSMAIAYNSAALDPSQAAVADRLRKQAKTRAVKELREAIREAPVNITAQCLRGHSGAMAPSKDLEVLLNRRTTKCDLEGDRERHYIFFDAKNRSAKDESPSEPVKHAKPTPPPYTKPSPPQAAALSGSKRRAAAQPQVALPQHPTTDRDSSPSNPAIARLQLSPGSPLSPGGRDGAAALMSLYNRGGEQGSPQDSPRESPRRRTFFVEDATSSSTPKQGPPSGKIPKQSLAAKAAANMVKPQNLAGVTSWNEETSPTGGHGAAPAGPKKSYLSLDITSPRAKPHSPNKEPTSPLSPRAQTPRTVSASSSNKLYAAVREGDVAAVAEVLDSKEGRGLLDTPVRDEASSLSAHLIFPGSRIEVESQGYFRTGRVVGREGDKVWLSFRLGRDDVKEAFALDSPRLRVPEELSGRGFTPLMCACTLDDPEQAAAVTQQLLTAGADVMRADCEGFTALHWAALAGHPAVLRHLVGVRGDVNLRSESTGETPLLLAASCGRSEAVRELLAAGADTKTRNQDGQGVIEIAGLRTPPEEASAREQVLDELLLAVKSLRTLVIHHDECQHFQAGAVLSSVRESVPAHRLEVSSQFPAATPKAVDAVHPQAYSTAAEEQSGSSVWKGALRGAGAACYAIDMVLQGQHRNAFCCVGHYRHVGSAEFEGAQRWQDAAYPLNWAAIAGSYALREHRDFVRRVAVIDLDVAVGGGAEGCMRVLSEEEPGPTHRVPWMYFALYKEDPDAEVLQRGRDNLYYNIVCDPLVHSSNQTSTATRRDRDRSRQDGSGGGPGAGGQGGGAGASAKEEFRRGVQYKLVPSLRAYCPDMVILSVGVGTARLATHTEASLVDDDDVHWAVQHVMSVASVCCDGRLAVLLEGGGYDSTADGQKACLSGRSRAIARALGGN